MAKKKSPSKALRWSKAGSDEIKKFTHYVEHCRHFAETIARRKEHPAVTDEDVADVRSMTEPRIGQCVWQGHKSRFEKVILLLPTDQLWRR